jgi:hypothetical protein
VPRSLRPLRFASWDSAIYKDRNQKLIVPQSCDDYVRVWHKSLPGFLQDAERCQDSRFYINTSLQHHRIASLCLIKVNPAISLKRWGIHNASTTGKTSAFAFEEAQGYVAPEVRYACLHWASHLARSGPPGSDSDVHALLETFCSRSRLRVQHWAQILILLGQWRGA